MAILRVLSKLLLTLLAVALVAASAVVLNGWRLTRLRVTTPAPPLAVTPDSSLVQRGAHLAAVSCSGCHAASLDAPLSGGHENYLAESGLPLGRLIAPNLTGGGVLAAWSDAEIARAIRDGVGQDGYPLLVMPSASLHGLSDRDVAAVIRYVRAQPAIANDVPKRHFTLLAYAILGAHLFETSRQPRHTAPVPDPPPGANAAHGEYLVGVLDCRTCHGPDLRGGRKGQFPPIGPDLAAVAAAHDEAAFDLALRRGVSARDGHALDPSQMPFAMFSRLDDDEAKAIYAYLRGLGTGPRPRG